MPFSGFPPEVKKYVIGAAGVIITLLAIAIERHIKIPLHWRKKPTVTEAATTYVEHNGSITSASK